MAMTQKTLEKRIRQGKRQPKEMALDLYGLKVQFNEAPSKNYMSYLRFEDSRGYLGALDPQNERKELRQLQGWIEKCLKSYPSK